MRTDPFIITLTGSSGCGKTYITDRILSLEKILKKENISFEPKRHWKYVTRPYRETEIIDKNKGNEIDVRSVKFIPEDCEFVYSTYGDEYGFKKSDLQNYLDRGESPIIVINDVRVIEELKEEFPNQVLSLFLFREIIPDVETHKKAGSERGGVSESKIISRFEKAIALYRVFIENIFLFDRVVLNVPYIGEGNIGEIQAEGVIRGVIDGGISLNKKITKTPQLFIVSGNAQSGKDDIIRAAKKLGKLQTDILIKFTNRWEENGDDGEIICKYKPKLFLLEQFEQDYLSELSNLEKEFSFENYKKRNKQILQIEYKSKKDKFKDEEEFLRVRFETEKLQKENSIKTGTTRFWEALQKEIEEKQTPLSEDSYNEIRDKYFERNFEYFDLDKLAKEKVTDYQRERSKIKTFNPKGENNSGLIQYKGKDIVLYENNKKLYGNPIFYGYEIGNIAKEWKNRDKHLVLTASLPNMFKICREQLGSENVITAFTYSQVSAEEHEKHSDKVVGSAKLQEYDDILRYAHHIADFDYALIFAETSVVNNTGNQKDELVDQMFRLFRVYNPDKNEKKIEHKNKLFVLSGASGSGKSTLLFEIVKNGLCQQAPKYSNRENRVLDDLIHIKEDVLKNTCDIVYERYNIFYGINTKEIKECLKNDNQVVVISDIKATKKLKEHLGDDSLIVFIYLQDLSIDNLLKERHKLNLEENERKELASEILSKNKNWFTSIDENIQKKIKKSFSNDNKKLQEFIKRCDTWIDLDIDYINNKKLFTDTIRGETVEELYDKFENQIFRKYTK